ncbi:MAG TPA: hypothetical protein ENI68_02955 [Gammaproteobacteria bacterium]|nr:hypothetical protein [Gammaproteobacteria bacterium]
MEFVVVSPRLAVAFLVMGFLPADFLLATFLVVVFLAAVFFTAGFFLLTAGFLLATVFFLTVVVFFAGISNCLLPIPESKMNAIKYQNIQNSAINEWRSNPYFSTKQHFLPLRY